MTYPKPLPHLKNMVMGGVPEVYIDSSPVVRGRRQLTRKTYTQPPPYLKNMVMGGVPEVDIDVLLLASCQKQKTSDATEVTLAKHEKETTSKKSLMEKFLATAST